MGVIHVAERIVPEPDTNRGIARQMPHREQLLHRNISLPYLPPNRYPAAAVGFRIRVLIHYPRERTAVCTPFGTSAANMVLGWENARLTDLFNMPVVCSAAPTKHVELREPAEERFVLTAKLHRIALVEICALIQFGVTHT